MLTMKISASKSAHAGFLAVLLLGGSAALAFEPPAAQPQVISAAGTYQAAFTPGDNAAGMIVQAIDSAQKQVLVQAFSFTNKAIARALLAARRRGVDVQIVSDQEQIAKMERGLVPEMAAKGIPVFVDGMHESAHNKVMVIDAGTAQPAVITGSFNFTSAAQYRNAENVLLIRGNEKLANAYLKNWQQHREHSHPYK